MPTTYEAELDGGPLVQRVVVSPHLGWAATNLGGTWQETSDPYDPTPTKVVYAGIGNGYDAGTPELFVGDHWTEEKATVPDENGDYRYTKNSELTFYEGKSWRNLQPEGNPNVWAPGVAGWREYPMGDEYPLWVQPVGSVDAYPDEYIVEHDGAVWASNVAANVWEPGATGITQWDQLPDN